MVCRRDRLDDAHRVELGIRSCESRVSTRGSVEDVEAHLVTGHVNRTLESNMRPHPGQLLGGLPRPALARRSLSGLATTEVRLDEVVRHAADAMAAGRAWKRQNV